MADKHGKPTVTDDCKHKDAVTLHKEMIALYCIKARFCVKWFSISTFVKFYNLYISKNKLNICARNNELVLHYFRKIIQGENYNSTPCN